MSTKSILEKVQELSNYLEQLCTLAINETDSQRQSEISAEIHRVIGEKQELEKQSGS